ncbi:MAG: cyclic nucleotide-binding domain-containing protein [bacterium]|nr:cyclic nucleotide-binding domain-containing protein [bacterium]
MEGPFNLLTENDWKQLLRNARRIAFKKDEVLIEEGATSKILYILREGYVRVDRNHDGQSLTYARLGPGELFGEMSFLEQADASASVIAEDDVEADAIDGPFLTSLLASEPGFSARFYNSLAVTLSHRLRDISVNLGELNLNEIAQVSRFHRTRLGHITDQQIPQELEDEIEIFQNVMSELNSGLRRRKIEESDVQSQVNARCNRMIDLLDQYTQPEALVEIGYDDLMSFRDTSHLDIGIGAYIFRETFNIFMLSQLIAHCYMKPRGFADDFMTSEMIYENEPQGDGRLGPFIDAWFESRPFCTARREIRELLTQIILQEAIEDTGVFYVTNLASGSCRELFDTCARAGNKVIETNCLDVDKDALAFAANLAKETGHADRFTFMQENVIAMSEGRGKFTIRPQEFIYSLGLFDYLSDEQAVNLLNWIHDHLQDGRDTMITNYHPSMPDKYFLDHILEWKINYRDADELVGLFSASKFTNAPEIKTVESGVNQVAICRK